MVGGGVGLVRSNSRWTGNYYRHFRNSGGETELYVLMAGKYYRYFATSVTISCEGGVRALAKRAQTTHACSNHYALMGLG